jgi:casein kinase II subunit alpha
VRVASRYYKGPELLVEDKKYHYSLDIWSLGCTLAGMLFRIETFFKGSDNYDQMARIVNVLGSEGLREYLRKYKLTLPSQVAKVVKSADVVPYESFISAKNQERATKEGIDLLQKMLVYDKNNRITPKKAMQHEYFAPIRALQE